MPKRRHVYEEVAEEIAEWLDEVADAVAEALHDGTRAPFGAEATEAEKLAYYESVFFLPDGSPNLEGRAMEMQRLGPDGYLRVAEALAKARRSPAENPPEEVAYG